MKKDHKSKTTDIVYLNSINELIQDGQKSKRLDPNDVSDGYHTFGQLYDCRLALTAALFNDWGNPGFDILGVKFKVHKSIRHHDGELCFGGGWFIVVAVLPQGQISFHYKMEDWDKFKIPEKTTALYEFDGHTTEDVINRLINI